MSQCTFRFDCVCSIHIHKKLLKIYLGKKDMYQQEMNGTSSSFYALATQYSQTVSFDGPNRKLFPVVRFMMCFMIVK